jgi:hypothetical protein
MGRILLAGIFSRVWILYSKFGSSWYLGSWPEDRHMAKVTINVTSLHEDTGSHSCHCMSARKVAPLFVILRIKVTDTRGSCSVHMCELYRSSRWPLILYAADTRVPHRRHLGHEVLLILNPRQRMHRSTLLTRWHKVLVFTPYVHAPIISPLFHVA